MDALSEMFPQVDAGQLQLTGKDGFVQNLIKAAFDRGLKAQLADHLGYRKDLYPNSRNGVSEKAVTRP